MGLAVIITFLVVSIYASVVMLLRSGLRKLGRDHDEIPGSPLSDIRKLEKVTVVIPFRNELLYLADLVGDLTRQSYPVALHEVIFVNDHSDDGSGELVESLIRENSRFTCLELPAYTTGKKEALFYGISRASSSWIIQTDSDCRVEEHFISSHMAFLRSNPSDMVAGVVTTWDGDGGFTEILERLDLLSLVASGAGSFHFGRPVMCNGANLLYSKELFLETRGFDPTDKVLSGDDMFLMIGARKLGKRLTFSTSRKALVQTAPCKSLGSMIAQRMRWGSKTMHYGMIDIQALALLVVLTNLLVLCSPVWLLWIPQHWPWILAGWALKTGVDFSILYTITGYTNQKKSLLWFLPVSISNYFIQMIILIGSVFGRSEWKGRT